MCCFHLPTCGFLSSITNTRENKEYLDDISLNPQGKSNYSRDISVVFFKMHKNLLPK
jgi:hypothetical protein